MSFSSSSSYICTNLGLIQLFSIKIIAVFTICLKNLFKLYTDYNKNTKNEKMKLDKTILQEKYNVSQELMEETVNYGLIPEFDLSIIHFSLIKRIKNYWIF